MAVDRSDHPTMSEDRITIVSSILFIHTAEARLIQLNTLKKLLYMWQQTSPRAVLKENQNMRVSDEAIHVHVHDQAPRHGHRKWHWHWHWHWQRSDHDRRSLCWNLPTTVDTLLGRGKGRAGMCLLGKLLHRNSLRKPQYLPQKQLGKEYRTLI